MTDQRSAPPSQQHIRDRCFHPAGTFEDFPPAEVDATIAARFETIAARYPERLAVRSRGRTLTYGELAGRAHQVARALLQQRGEGEEPIALLLEHDLQIIGAVLGALEAGKIYVPLDPTLPRARLAAILEDSGAKVIVTNDRYLALAGGLAGGVTTVLDVDRLDGIAAPVAIDPQGSPDSAACILYTSGSTGEPKGVVRNHRDTLHAIRTYTNDIHVCRDDRLSLLHACSASAAIRNLFGGLLNGALVSLFDVKERGAADLGRWLVDEQITIYHSVSTLFTTLTDALAETEAFPDLRLVQLSSEQVTPRDVERYQRHFSRDCILVNRLGTTETGTFRRYFVAKDSAIPERGVPVGYPVEGTEVLLLDEHGQEVGEGEIGQIVVRGRFLSAAYWRRPELTAEKFRPDPAGGPERLYLTGDLGRRDPDGCLWYLGRSDFQVKIGGRRIEVGEIEAALVEHPALASAVVVDRTDARGSRRLVAYVVPHQRPGPTPGGLRGFLREKLADYLVPAAFVILESLPLTAGGKVDRRALPALDSIERASERAFVPPRTTVEHVVAGIWAEVLSVDRVGVDDAFLELGGNSLLAAQVISRMIRTLGEVPVAALLKASTVAEMSGLVTAGLLREVESLTDEQARGLLERGSGEPGG